MKSYIYALQDIQGNIRYIGKTIKPIEKRLWEHINESRRGNKTYKCDWIRSCIVKGYLPLIKIIDGPIDGDGSLEERYWIARYRREGCDLTNATDGGEGGWGNIPSKESLIKRSESLKKSWACSPERRIKLSEFMRGNKYTLGYKTPIEKKIKMSCFMKGNKYSLGRRLTEQTKLKIGKASKGRIQSLETRLKRSQSLTGMKYPNRKPISDEQKSCSSSSASAPSSHF